MIGRAFLAVVTFLLFGCAAAVAPRVPHVTVEERAGDRWRVSYVLPEPAASVTFARDRGLFRSAKWRIVEPAGARWTVGGEREAIAFATPTSRFAIELAADTALREKDYNVHFRFTDGSTLLYTGHFQVANEPSAKWTFRTTPERDVRVLDRHGRGSLDWSSNHDTYVYFGGISAVQTPRMTLIADPGLPPWIATQVRELVPRQIDYFAEKLGTELAFKPLLVVSYSGEQSPGLSFKGGTLPGLVQISVAGSGWATETFDARQLWFSRLAHEAFHLWNGEMFPPGRDAEWLSEAAAEHAAFLALRDFGLIDEQRRREIVVEQTNECIVRLGGTALLGAPPRNFYTCGLALLELAGEEVMWPAYRHFFSRDGRYSTDDFLRALPQEKSAPIEEFVRRGPGAKTDAFFARHLAAKGWSVSRVRLAEATVTQSVARAVTTEALRRCACRTLHETRCGTPGRIETINSIDARRQPAEAYASLLGSPESTVTIEGKAETFRCSAADADPSYDQMLRLQR